MSMQRYSSAFKGHSIQATNGTPLTDADLRRYVPAIFATEAHESRSARFAPVPTSTVLAGLRDHGFEPYAAAQAKTRDASKVGFTKHMLRMRHPDLANGKGDAFEVLLVNGNDGSSAYKMLPGYFRFVCLNGLICGETFDEVNVRHSGNAVEQVIEGAFTVLRDAPRVTGQIEEFKALTMSRDATMAFAEAAHVLRFPLAHVEDEDADMRREAPIDAATLLKPRRFEDTKQDLWTVFNRIQENAVEGGQSGRVTGQDGKQRRATTRPVTGIDGNKALNRALWTLTERMAKLVA